MMTREDMLRELELLPVWQLRVPAQLQPQPAETAPTQVTEPAQVIEPAQTLAEVISVQAAFSYSLIVSSDKKWAFVLPASPDLSASQAILFNNILQALKIDKTNKSVLTSFVDINASVIIAMGESAAQALLNSADSIESLRNKTHTVENIPLIVTYHPHDILLNLANKAKTWDDLCMAMKMLQA